MRARTPINGLRQKLRVAVKKLGFKDFRTDLRRDIHGVYLTVQTKESCEGKCIFYSFEGHRVCWIFNHE